MIDPMQIDLASFVRTWHGPADAAVVKLPPSCDWLPAPLKDWYEFSSQWSTPLMTLKEMKPADQVAIDCGRAIFLEDFGDQAWAFDVEDPLVVLERQSTGEWLRLSEGISEFIVHNVMQESAYMAPYWRSCVEVPDVQLQQILAPMNEVAFGDWFWPRPGHRIFFAEGLVADIGPAMEDLAPWGIKAGYSEVQIGALNPVSLTYLREVQGVEWATSE
ncbi:hypothetical protein [Streptomyces sp. NPDC001594]|uniref:hypothetical protein n=1 Tax=Streptomyces sp. NPDC001594 TaxID=3364590 RepID=UPI00369E2532